MDEKQLKRWLYVCRFIGAKRVEKTAKWLIDNHFSSLKGKTIFTEKDYLYIAGIVRYVIYCKISESQPIKRVMVSYLIKQEVRYMLSRHYPVAIQLPDII